MPAPANIDEFLDVVRKSNQVDPSRLEAYMQRFQNGDTLPPEPKKFAALLIREGLLTNFQAEQFLQGRYKGFHLGGYRIIERIGTGGSGSVYLGEHEVMKRKVALKILPSSIATEPGVLERFRREAQAAAALDHPNIVRAYDFRQDGQVHFLVMEYVNGPSLEQVLRTQGAMSVPVACEYIRQAAIGLEHAHEAGLVHRDVKPGNLLVDPSGIVKLLDLGLARFAPEGQDSLTKQFDENTVMGTADYLAPEQALNLHNVDRRADIYSLGATLYALLAGQPPFGEGSVTQKLLWHQMRDPAPLCHRRSDIPYEIGEIVSKMMAKDVNQRYQSCAEIAEVLAPFSSATPTPQGPARPGASNGASSPYVNATKVGPGTSAKRKKAVVIPSEPSPPKSSRKIVRKEDRDVREERRDRTDYDREERRSRLPDIRQPADTGAMSIVLLIAAMGGILLLVGGVIAFLVFGPTPNATSTRPLDDEEPKLANVSVKPGPVPPITPVGQGLPLSSGQVFWLPAHGKPVERIAFTGDGKRLVTSGQDRLIKIWDVLQKREISTIKGHTGEVYGVSFGNADTQVLSSSADGTVRIWNVTDGKQTKLFKVQQKGKVWCAIFGRTPNDLLTAGEDGIVRQWQVSSGKKIRDLKGHKGPVNGLAMRPGATNQAVSASWDKTLRFWNLDNGTTIRELTGHTGQVASVAVTLDGRAISGSYDGTVRVWHLDSGKNIHTFTGHQKEVWIVAVSPDGHRAISGGVDRRIRVWDLKRMKLEHTFEGHTESITGLAFASSGRHFASCSLDGTLRVWGLPMLQP
jgi:serine/threonine protein kinase